MIPGQMPAQGLYDPRNEHDSCGVGFIVDLKGRKSHQLVRDGLTALFNMNHRGACGCENNTGDGARPVDSNPSCLPGLTVHTVGNRPSGARALWRGCVLYVARFHAAGLRESVV